MTASTSSSPSSSRRRRPMLEPRALRAALRTKLPAYMVPARFEAISSLPKLSSGKVDRKSSEARPACAGRCRRRRRKSRARRPRRPCSWRPKRCCRRRRFLSTRISSPISAAIRCWPRASSRSCARRPRSPASRCRTSMRRARCAPSASMLDRKWRACRARAKNLSFAPPPLLRRFLCGLAQALSLPFILGLVSAQWLGVFVSYMLLTGADATLLEEILSAASPSICSSISRRWRSPSARNG